MRNSSSFLLRAVEAEPAKDPRTKETPFVRSNPPPSTPIYCDFFSSVTAALATSASASNTGFTKFSSTYHSPT